MRTSYSSLQTFKQCPQKYKFQDIDKIKAPKSIEAVFGSAVHGALKFMFSHDPLFPTLEEVLLNFSESWRTAALKLDNNNSKELLETYDESGKGMIKSFYAKNQPWNFSVVDTESRFEVLLPDAKNQKNHILAGIIDRIDKIGDGEYEIIDYKTSRRLPSQENVDQDFQMSLYHMALVKRWPNTDPEKINLSLYFLKHNEKISSKRNAARIEETANDALGTIREIEEKLKTNDFPPMPSALCSYCAYKPICPAWKHLYKKDGSPPPEEAQLQEALREYFAIKESETKNAKKIKDLQAIIKSYMEANGVERVFDERGYFVSKKLQQRFKYDFDKIRDILLSAGLRDKWEAILEADEKKLKEIMLTLPSSIRDEILRQKSLSKEFVTLTASTRPVKK